MATVESPDARPGPGNEWKRALVAYAIALPLALFAEWGVRYVAPEVLPSWFNFAQSVTILMVGIVFVYVGFLPLGPRPAKSMAWANAGLLAFPYTLVFVINPIGETLTTWLILWPTATAFLFAAAVTVAVVLTAPGWLRFARRRRRRDRVDILALMRIALATARFLLATALVLLGAAGIYVIVSTFPGFQWRSVSPSPLSAGTAALVAAVAGLVALAAERSWRTQREDERATDLRRRRSDYYVGVIRGVIDAFLGGTARSIAEDRATIAVWGSPQMLSEMEEWNTFSAAVMKRSAGTGEMLPDEKTRAHELIGRLVLAARNDLEMVGKVTGPDVSAMIFQDYVRPAANGS